MNINMQIIPPNLGRTPLMALVLDNMRTGVIYPWILKEAKNLDMSTILQFFFWL